MRFCHDGMKRSSKIFALIICCSLLSACAHGNGNENPQTVVTPVTTAAAVTETSSPTDSPAPTTTATAPANEQAVTPTLPQEAASPEGFAPEGWKLLDSVALDYNGDGNTDIVGVLDHVGGDGDPEGVHYPRVLFSAANTGNGAYKLDFTDTNLVLSDYMGGVYGDPYEPMTSEGNTFTLNVFGGSNWKWSEASTFEYMDGGWYLVKSDSANFFSGIPISRVTDDYKAGISHRNYNDDSAGSIEYLSNYPPNENDYDLSFTVDIGAPIPIKTVSRQNGSVDSTDDITVVDGITKQYYWDGADGISRYLGALRGNSANWQGSIDLTGRIGSDLGIHMHLDVAGGNVTGSYSYDKHGINIPLEGTFSRGNLDLCEGSPGAITGYMTGLTMNDGTIEGAWRDANYDGKCLPLILVKDEADLPAYAPPTGEVQKFFGDWHGVGDIPDVLSSSLSITPLFDGLAFIDASAFWAANLSPHNGGFYALAVMDNSGLNFQPANDKTYPDNETVVFRLTVGAGGGLDLYSNEYDYSCGAGVAFDSAFVHTK